MKPNEVEYVGGIRERLAWFLFNSDFSSLEQALAVARHNPTDLKLIEQWCKREGEPGKYQTLADRLEKLG